MNAGVFDAWAQIMHALPDARLVLFRETIRGEVAQQIQTQFGDRGVAAERLDLLCRSTATHGYDGYMMTYHDIDICLDTFPANAGTTACEALWMGVPWLTIYGDRFFGRQTATALSRLGLTDWIARTTDDLVKKAVEWSEKIGVLADLRSELRRRFQESTLGDARQYTRGLEAAYRDIWMRWCESGK